MYLGKVCHRTFCVPTQTGICHGEDPALRCVSHKRRRHQSTAGLIVPWLALPGKFDQLGSRLHVPHRCDQRWHRRSDCGRVHARQSMKLKLHLCSMNHRLMNSPGTSNPIHEPILRPNANRLRQSDSSRMQLNWRPGYVDGWFGDTETARARERVMDSCIRVCVEVLTPKEPPIPYAFPHYLFRFKRIPPSSLRPYFPTCFGRILQTKCRTEFSTAGVFAEDA